MVIDGVPIVGVFGATIAALVLLGYAFKITRFLVRLLKSTSEFLDDWKGELERPGFPARPGIPERVARIEAQLQTNGGMSLRDQTNRVEAKLDAHIMASGDHD